MKILAIRRANLASPAGELQIDVVEGSLGIGVFAIAGSTGAKNMGSDPISGAP